MAETTMNSQAEPGLVRHSRAQGSFEEEPEAAHLFGRGFACNGGGSFQRYQQTPPSQQAAARHEPPQPTVQDNTDNNVQDLKNQLAAEQQKRRNRLAWQMRPLPNRPRQRHTAQRGRQFLAYRAALRPAEYVRAATGWAAPGLAGTGGGAAACSQGA